MVTTVSSPTIVRSKLALCKQCSWLRQGELHHNSKPCHLTGIGNARHELLAQPAAAWACRTQQAGRHKRPQQCNSSHQLQGWVGPLGLGQLLVDLHTLLLCSIQAGNRAEGSPHCSSPQLQSWAH